VVPGLAQRLDGQVVVHAAELLFRVEHARHYQSANVPSRQHLTLQVVPAPLGHRLDRVRRWELCRQASATPTREIVSMSESPFRSDEVAPE